MTEGTSATGDRVVECLVYLDDKLVFGPSDFATTLEWLTSLLDCLLVAGLKRKAKKCQLCGPMAAEQIDNPDIGPITRRKAEGDDCPTCEEISPKSRETKILWRQIP